jgi:hypothetical protein
VSGDRWQFAVANNIFFAVSGESAFKLYLNGTTPVLAQVGIPRPSSGLTAGPVSSGVMTGTFDVKVTWYNSATGTESSASDTVTTAFNSQKLSVTFAQAAPYGVDRFRVYIRKQGLQTGFYRDASMEYEESGARYHEYNLTDLQLNNLTLEAPDTAENDPPPAGITDICWHLSRLFATDGRKIYFSKIGNPEQFDPESIELVGIDDGQKIMAIYPLHENALAVFKER